MASLIVSGKVFIMSCQNHLDTPMPSRRIFLIGSTAAVAAKLAMPRHVAAQTVPRYRLAAGRATAGLLEDSAKRTDVWAYNGLVPGPLLRARKGEEIEIEFVNRLDQPTTIHWHGIRIDNAMDGVAGLTQPAIQPGESYTYRFTSPDAGTYWYHPHNRTWEQLARGLYGTLIVEGDSEANDFDRDYPIVADDWRLDDQGMIDEASFGNLGDWAHAGRLGNELTLNGKAYERLEVANGERIRLRFINTANARIMRFAISGQKALLIALDGQPVPPVEIEADGIVIAPAQRADLLVDIKGNPGDEIEIIETSSGNRLAAGYLVVSNEEGKTDGMPKRQPFGGLKPNSLPKIETAAIERASRYDLVMSGGAMRFLASGVYKGEELDGRTLAQTHQQLWAFNGIAGMAKEPFFKLKSGEIVKIRLINETLWPHAIHLHGHHFSILSRSGNASAEDSEADNLAHERQAYRDTVLVDRNETVEIALVADNPGKWMLHCHMLEHQASGMGTWFEVV